jgi:hypothetical protein
MKNSNETAVAFARVLGYSLGLLFRAAIFVAFVHLAIKTLDFFNLMPPV